MTTIREEAMAYMPPLTKNIADLEHFSIDLELFDGEGKDKEEKEFKYKFILVNDIEYRVPGSVLGGIKTILKKFPKTKYVSVLKDGEKLNTRYQVIPMTTVMEEKVE